MTTATEITTSAPRRMDIAGSSDGVDTSTIGGRMAFARMRRKMTQKELAERIPNKTGKAKSRATIVQYENDNIQPPLDVIELIAKQLDVSPSYIAYGERVVAGLAHHKESEMISFPEITFGRDGEFVSDTIAFSKAKVASLGIDRDDIRGYILPHAAPHFGLKEGDTLIVDSSYSEPTSQQTLYALKTSHGMEIVEIDRLGSSVARSKPMTMTGPDGNTLQRKRSELTFLGAVVSTIRN